jgi:hypothetical protein
VIKVIRDEAAKAQIIIKVLEILSTRNALGMEINVSGVCKAKLDKGKITVRVI